MWSRRFKMSPTLAAKELIWRALRNAFRIRVVSCTSFSRERSVLCQLQYTKGNEVIDGRNIHLMEVPLYIQQLYDSRPHLLLCAPKVLCESYVECERRIFTGDGMKESCIGVCLFSDYISDEFLFGMLTIRPPGLVIWITLYVCFPMKTIPTP